MVVYNLLNVDKKVGYVDIGSWLIKVIKEVKVFGQIEVLVLLKDKNYSYIFKGYEIFSDFIYLYVIGNNMIFGI